jgi:hypothetical protein
LDSQRNYIAYCGQKEILLTKSVFATEVTRCDIQQIKGITGKIETCQDLKGNYELLQVSQLNDVCKNVGPYPFAGVAIVDAAVVLLTFSIDNFIGVCAQDQTEVKMKGITIVFPEAVINELAKKALITYINY